MTVGRRRLCKLEREAMLSNKPSLVLIPEEGKVTLRFYRGNDLPDSDKNSLKASGLISLRRYEMKHGQMPTKLLLKYNPEKDSTETYVLRISSQSSVAS